MAEEHDPLYKKYILSIRVGCGAYGVVYQATCAKTGVAKAIKFLDPNAEKSGRDSFEIGALRACSHPNVIELEEIIDSVKSKTTEWGPEYSHQLQQLLQGWLGSTHPYLLKK